MADQPSNYDAASKNTNFSQQDTQPEPEPEPEIVKFSPEQEAELLSESNSHKQEATSFYLQGSFDLAINKYTEANAVLPNYLDYELAVLQSNISACHLKLKEWKEANVAATTSLDRLDKVDAQFALETKAAGDSESLASGAEKDKSKAVPNDDTDADSLACTKRQADSKRIRYKALMRRARARFELGGWQNLEGALTDYTALQKMDNLTVADRKLAAAQLRALPSLVAQAKEKETAQMWDQLKQARRLSLPCICSLSLSLQSCLHNHQPNTQS